MRKVLLSLCRIAPDMKYWQNTPLVELSYWGEALVDEGEDS